MGDRGRDGRMGKGGMRSWEERVKSGVSGCESVCVMSGWPWGAVDSLRCSADVLTGSRPFARPSALLAAKRTGVGVGGAGEMGEGERRLESWERMWKMDGGRN